MDEELALCAQVNFENLLRAVPALAKHPYWIIAKAQLDEALGGKTVEEVLGPFKTLGTVELKGDGTVETTGIIESVTKEE